jgi:hypothetical protein
VKQQHVTNRRADRPALHPCRHWQLGARRVRSRNCAASTSKQPPRPRRAFTIFRGATGPWHLPRLALNSRLSRTFLKDLLLARSRSRHPSDSAEQGAPSRADLGGSGSERLSATGFCSWSVAGLSRPFPPAPASGEVRASQHLLWRCDGHLAACAARPLAATLLAGGSKRLVRGDVDLLWHGVTCGGRAAH